MGMGMLAAAFAVAVVFAGCATDKAATARGVGNAELDGVWTGASGDGTMCEMTISDMGENWLQVVTNGASMAQYKGTLTVSGLEMTLTTTHTRNSDAEDWTELAGDMTGTLAEDLGSFLLAYDGGELVLTRN